MKEQILKTLKSYLEVNQDVLLDSEIEDIRKQISHIEGEIKMEKHNAYIKQLKDFRDHMSNTFDVLMGDACTDESVDIFYRSEFEISFRGKTVRVINGASIFQNIEYALGVEIEEQS